MVSPEILRRYPFFAGIDDDFLNSLAMASDEIVLADGVWLFHEGDQADGFYVIMRGTIQLKARLPGSQYADLDQLVEGDTVGWSALCQSNFYTLSAFAPSGARLLRLESKAARTLMQERPEMGYPLMCQLAQAMGKRLTDLRNRFVSVAAP